MKTTSHSRLDFWSQSFPFSCGPAALGGVLSLLGWPTPPDRRLAEIEIWRESTAVACPGAHPLGLALAARRRRFAAEVHWSGPRPWLWAHIRSRHERFRLRDYVEVETFLARQCATEGVSIRRSDLPPGRLEAGLLLSTASEGKDSEPVPHWVGLLPKSGGFLVLDPLRQAPYRSSRSLSAWWDASGFEETRSWVGIRPRTPPSNQSPRIAVKPHGRKG
jgi:hypothetical protein